MFFLFQFYSPHSHPDSPHSHPDFPHSHPIPHIPHIPSILTQIPRISTPFPASPPPPPLYSLYSHSHSPHSVPRFPIPAFTDSRLPAVNVKKIKSAFENLKRKSKYCNINIFQLMSFCDCRIPKQQLFLCQILSLLKID